MKTLTYATVCSGIECMSAAVADLPMRPVFFSEIEPFPCAVLKSHFPDVPNLGDMSKIEVSNDGKEITNGSVRIVLDERLDIFAGGTPRQDVSVAGKRRGMEEGSNTRSSLAFEFVRLVRELKPRFVIWENVAGVLSDKSFPEFLTALANCGYGVAYRTLDAQYIRVADCYHEDGGVVRMERAIPQRRRRVWVVGCAGGDVAKAAQILFEFKGIAGDNPPRRRTGQEIAEAIRGRNRVHGEMVGGASRDGETIALDGDKLKPRTDQRKGGNGFGINEDGAGYTLTGVDRHGVAYKAVRGGGKEDVGEALTARSFKGIGARNGEISGAFVAAHCYENHAQERVVHTTNSNGGDVMPTLDGKGQSASGPGAQEDKRGGYVITHTANTTGGGVCMSANLGESVRLGKRVCEEDSAVTLRASDGKMGDNQPVVAMSYDGYNQAGKEECCHTLGTCNSESPNNDKVVKVAIKCCPLNSMVLGKDLKVGDRQTVGFGDETDPTVCPSSSTPSRRRNQDGRRSND